MKILWLMAMGWVCSLGYAAGQTIDTAYVNLQDSNLVEVDVPYQHSVKKAVRYSAMLPGLGQAYNKKYWKIPVIYGLMGFTAFNAVDFHGEYIRYRDAYRIRVLDDPNNRDEFFGVINNPLLRQTRDDFRQNRDLLIILTVGVYLLNIVDATVDAHLFHFNVSDDLTVRMLPQAPQFNVSTGQWEFAVATIRLKL